MNETNMVGLSDRLARMYKVVYQVKKVLFSLCRRKNQMASASRVGILQFVRGSNRFVSCVTLRTQRSLQLLIQIAP